MYKEDIELLHNQVNLLAKWNEKNIKRKPEQVRKNIETITEALTKEYGN